MSTVHSLLQFEKNIYYKNVHYMYRTRAIITCGLYTFYLIFDGQKPFFKELFFVKFWLYVRLVFKSIVGYSGSVYSIHGFHWENIFWKTSYKVQFTDRCRRQNFHPSLLCLVYRLYKVIHKTQKTRMKVLPSAMVSE